MSDNKINNKQIEIDKLNIEIRSHWLVIFANIFNILSISFILFGGFVFYKSPYIIGDATISIIVGVITIYIGKLLMDAYKLCIAQLGVYYKESIINSNVLMAIEITNKIENKDLKDQSYQKIINSISLRIESDKNTNS